MFEMRRSKNSPVMRLDKNEPGVYQTGVILFPAALWDLLESGLYMNTNVIRCSVCESLYDTKTTMRGERLKELGLCFECNFWKEKYQNHIEDPKHQIICEGRAYFIQKEDTLLKGFGGSKFVIKFDDGSIVETTNLWHNGEVPKRFRPMLPDNCKFVSSWPKKEEPDGSSAKESARRPETEKSEPETSPDSDSSWIPLQEGQSGREEFESTEEGTLKSTDSSSS